MDQLILSCRAKFVIPAVLVIGLGVWLLLCKAHHQSYWSGTIYRVQTVDFNMLHRSLPPTLSQLIAVGRDDLIQDVLDSNYGIFGLVITNPGGDSIIYKTNREYKRSSWQPLVTPAYLQQSTEPFDLLTDPPPLTAQYGHKTPRSGEAEQLGPAPSGRVLGRIYYLRQPPPPFAEDLSHFLSTNIWELSGAKRGYVFISCISLGFCLAVILLILWHKRGLELKQLDLEFLERELKSHRQALDHLTSELVAQKARKEWLEREADLVYQRALDLKNGLELLRLSLNQQESYAPPQQSASAPAFPAATASSNLLSEIESLVPELTGNAKTLKAEAGQLHDYCRQLETRQNEMKRILDQAFPGNVNTAENVIPFKSRPL